MPLQHIRSTLCVVYQIKLVTFGFLVQSGGPCREASRHRAIPDGAAGRPHAASGQDTGLTCFATRIWALKFEYGTLVLKGKAMLSTQVYHACFRSIIKSLWNPFFMFSLAGSLILKNPGV